MTPDLILHVGMDKTGTSSIQYALQQAQVTLAKQYQILVPRTGLWNDFSHHPFAFSAFGIEGYGQADLDRLFKDLKAEVEMAACATVLLTSECLFRLPGHPAMRDVHSRLSRMFGRIRVIIYVRRQDHWIESRYRHSIISGNEEPLLKLAAPQMSDYLSAVNLWSDALGRENVILRPYEQEQFPYGNIAADFEAVIGLPPQTLLDMRQIRRNETFPFEAVLLRAALNHLRLPGSAIAGLNEALLQVIPKRAQDRTFLSPEAAHRVLEANATSNSTLARDYLGRADGRLFVGPLPNPQTEFEPSVLTRARLIGILSALREIRPDILKGAVQSAKDLRLRDLPFAPAAALAWEVIDAISELESAERPGDPVRRPPIKGHALPAPRPGAIARLCQGFRRRLTAPVRRQNVGGSAAPEILIHFGMVKTGTTSIQRTLFEHSAGLTNCALVDCGTPNGSQLVSSAVQSAETIRKTRAPAFSADAIEERRAPARLQLERALIAAANRSRKLLLSAEIISGFSNEDLGSLRDLLLPHISTIRFIGYMRDPVSQMQSVFQERIKTQLSPAFFLEAQIAAGPQDSFRIVDRLDALFGRDTVDVHPFEPPVFPGGDVVRHFLQAANVVGTGLSPTRQNETLSQTAVKALFCYRKLRAPHEPPNYGRSRAAFIADLQAIVGPGFAFHPDLTSQLRARSGTWDDWAERRIGRPLHYIPAGHSTGIRADSDLLTFSAREVDTLATWAEQRGIPTLRAGSGAEDVAEAIHLLRRRHAEGY